MPVIGRDEADHLIRRAFNALRERQPDLFEYDVSERSMVHHLACAIEALVPTTLRVDIEYNRHGFDPKSLLLREQTALDGPELPRRVFPDLVVHKRGSDDCNLIVLEVKKEGRSLDFDRLKLRKFRREFGYQHAAHVILHSRGGQEYWEWVDD